MTSQYLKVLAVGWAVALAAAVPSAGQAGNDPLFVSIGEMTRPPIGWVDFCNDHPLECKVAPTAAKMEMVEIQRRLVMSHSSHQYKLKIWKPRNW